MEIVFTSPTLLGHSSCKESEETHVIRLTFDAVRLHLSEYQPVSENTSTLTTNAEKTEWQVW